MEPDRKSDDVFVLRMWCGQVSETNVFRGRVEHTKSGQSRYVANFGDVCDFILRVRAGAREADPKR
jgi:hypothetical protein